MKNEFTDIVKILQSLSRSKNGYAWKDLPSTEAIDRNTFDYEPTSLNPNYEISDDIEEIMNIFQELSGLKNHFISAAKSKEMFGNLIKQYDFLEKEQKWKVFIIWATKYYVEISHLKQLMNQNVSDFESLVKTVNDLRRAIEPGKDYSG